MPGDLETFLHSYTGLVLVNLWGQGCEASLYMDHIMCEFERVTHVPVLRLTLTEYRDWARAHGIYGTPALVVYYQGRPLFRLIGRTTPAELLRRLRRHGIERL
jgi:thiol-disulfide isomerase/thioredoxin